MQLFYIEYRPARIQVAGQIIFCAPDLGLHNSSQPILVTAGSWGKSAMKPRKLTLIKIVFGLLVTSLTTSCSSSNGADTEGADSSLDPSSCEKFLRTNSLVTAGSDQNRSGEPEVPPECMQLLQDAEIRAAAPLTRLPTQPIRPGTNENSGVITQPDTPPEYRIPVAPRHPMIIGGKPAKNGEFPAAVALANKRIVRNWRFSFCGGTLIDERWVVTAAHCDVQSGDRVVVGLTDLDGLNDSSNGQYEHADKFYEINHVIRHDKYNKDTNIADIALLRLARPVPAAIGRPVPLINPQGIGARAGDSLTITGWGDTSEAVSESNYSSRLMHADVPVVDHETCKNNYEQKGYFIADTMLCAGSFGVGSCYGDSGGGAITTGSGAPVLAGVVSWGIECGAEVREGVFTRVSDYRSWITRQTGT